MPIRRKKILEVIFLLCSCLGLAQVGNTDSLRGDFTYLLTYRPNKLNKSIVAKETFSLQVSDHRAFFISVNRLKFDSIFKTQFKMNQGNIDMRSFSSSQPMSQFTIIQTGQDSKFYESVGRTKLFYNSPLIKNWMLSGETKIINSIKCKKAEVHYKGRHWIAWYSAEIPFPYGPYKFSGLPGLIIKITDDAEDFDFELVKSVSNKNLKGKVVELNTGSYTNAKEVKKEELVQAKSDFKENAKEQLKNMGTVFSDDHYENPADRRRRMEIEDKQRNPLEMED